MAVIAAAKLKYEYNDHGSLFEHLLSVAKFTECGEQEKRDYSLVQNDKENIE